MSIPVLYDACVLYGNEVRDLLMRIAISGMVRALWTDEILDEAFGSLVANRPDLSAERLAVTRERMNLAVPGALIGGHETLVEALKLPDPDDRHVLAAAITAGAVVIVTSNLNDFPAETLEPFGIGAKTPDDFVLDQISLDEGKVRDCVHQIARGRHDRRRRMKRSSTLSRGPAWSVQRRRCGTDPRCASHARLSQRGQAAAQYPRPQRSTTVPGHFHVFLDRASGCSRRHSRCGERRGPA